MMHLKNNKSGATLMEVLIACATFTFVVMALFGMIRYATVNWRITESRINVQNQLRKINTSISDEIKRTSFSTVLTDDDLSPAYSGYVHAIAFRSYINPDTNRMETDSLGTPQSNGYILLFCVRPTDDPCAFECVSNGDDVKCPHKIVVRVDLTKNTNGVDTWDPVELDSSSFRDYLPRDFSHKYYSSGGISVSEYAASIDGDAKYIRNVYVVAKDILSFNPIKNEPVAGGCPGILLTMRSFKKLESGLGDDASTMDDLTRSRFSVEIQNMIIPMNP